ncbi:hypothetical protein FOA52_001776 [Chlamydomonas sp. UWO 241]|nr:hypothetical protein FOA52_001776 [Chlamydomonas sp. UWO 241]
MARLAVLNFKEQTYANKRLIIVNHGAHAVMGGDSDSSGILERRVVKGAGTTLGALRNAALDLVPVGELWTPWDDDDLRSSDFLAKLQRAMGDADLVAFVRRIEYNCNTGMVWQMTLRSGFVFVLARRDEGFRYKDVDTMEDTELLAHYAGAARAAGAAGAAGSFGTFGTRILDNDDATMYVRLVHGTSNTSLYVDPNKRSVLGSGSSGSGSRPPSTRPPSAWPPSADSAWPPSADSARPPSADPARPPSADPARPPSADSARPPSADSARPPSADPARPPSADPARPPSADSAALGSAGSARPPSADSARPPSARPPSADSARPPSADPARPPSARPPSADPARPPSARPPSADPARPPSARPPSADPARPPSTRPPSADSARPPSSTSARPPSAASTRPSSARPPSPPSPFSSTRPPSPLRPAPPSATKRVSEHSMIERFIAQYAYEKYKNIVFIDAAAELKLVNKGLANVVETLTSAIDAAITKNTNRITADMV